MSLYKRGSIYWYKFTFNGEAIPGLHSVSLQPSGSQFTFQRRRRSTRGWSQH